MTGEPHLKEGDQGQWVEYAQAVMAEKGFTSNKQPDGVFDEQTREQVIAFQEHNQIHPANGEIGEHTWAALGGVSVVHEEAEHTEHDGGQRNAEDMQQLRDLVIGIAKQRLEFHFGEVARAAASFHRHALGEAQMLGDDPEPDVFAIFEAATSVFGYLFPEAELTKLVAELAISAFKQGVETAGHQAVSAEKRDIITLAQNLADSTTDAGKAALQAGEAALSDPSDPATAALQMLDHLPQVHEREWLEYAVGKHLGIPDPVTHSPYLYVLEPLEEKLAMAIARHKQEHEYGTPDTPFWKEQEQEHEEDAKVRVEVEYEHKGWRETEQ